MTLLAMALAAAAAALVVGPWPGRGLGSARAGAGRSRGKVGVALLGLVGGVMVAMLDGPDLALGLVALVAGTGGLRLWRRGRRRRDEERRRTAVVEVAEALVGELRAGRPALQALERGRQVWPPFAPVAAVARLGADVPGALRRLAGLPGAEGLREVAAAWQVSERSGMTLATALGQVAESARAQRAATHLVRAELASAQATARLVALLPVATLAMSSGIGADPWSFLLTRPIGLACLAAGVVLVLAGLWWIDRVADAVTRR